MIMDCRFRYLIETKLKRRIFSCSIIGCTEKPINGRHLCDTHSKQLYIDSNNPDYGQCNHLNHTWVKRMETLER